MLTTIRELIEREELQLEETVYQFSKDEVLDFPLTIGDFIHVCEGKDAIYAFGDLKEYMQYQEEARRDSEEYQSLLQRQIALSELFQKKKRKEIVPSKDEEREWKEEKKEIRRKLEQLEEEIAEKTEQQFGYNETDLECLQYKNTAYFTSYTDIAGVFPQLAGLPFSHLQKAPMLISHADKLDRAIRHGREIGMVGGPCLFGKDEVLIHFKLESGETATFDCCNGRRCLQEEDKSYTLREYVDLYGEQICDVQYENRKTGITRQEYDSIAYVFAAAKGLGAKIVFPLPDMSYMKYMESDLRSLKEPLRTEKLKEFREHTYQIADGFLKEIEVLGAQYSQVEYCVLHQRNEEICRMFYEKREPYLKASSYIQKLTKDDGKSESIIDYITMLALPWYIYGTKYIVQFDSLDETDSGRKCRKIHKNDIHITQLLYPEYLSRDEKNTIYNAPIAYKDYKEWGILPMKEKWNE